MVYSPVDKRNYLYSCRDLSPIPCYSNVCKTSTNDYQTGVKMKEETLKKIDKLSEEQKAGKWKGNEKNLLKEVLGVLRRKKDVK